MQSSMGVPESGAADESKNVNLKTALENVGIEVNEELSDFYKQKMMKQRQKTELQSH